MYWSLENVPWTNLHDLNLDWIVNTMKQTVEQWIAYRLEMDGKYADFTEQINNDFDNFTTQINTWKTTIESEFSDLQTYVQNYFDNLDLNESTRYVINQMIASGEFIQVLNPSIVSATEAWLENHITPTTPAVDDTLTISGAAADAKATGDIVFNLQDIAQIIYDSINKLPILATENLVNNVTVNYADGVLTANGTANTSGGRGVHIADFTLDPGVYTFYRNPSTLQVFIQKDAGVIISQLNTGVDSVHFTLTEQTNCYLGVNVLSGTTYNNTINIQVEKNPTFTVFTRPSDGTAIDKTARNELENNVVNVINQSVIIDLNNTENNKIRRYPTNSLNTPSNEGILLNANPSTDTGFQLVVDRYGTMYYRQKWATWGNWAEIVKRLNLIYINTGSNTVDLDTIQNNSVYRCANGSTNLPFDETEGTVITFGGSNDTCVQFFISRYGSVYHRNKWAVWTSWVEEFTNKSYINTASKTNILTAFSNIYCIGDSLTWSQVYTGSGTQRQAYTTYPATIEKLTGVPTTFDATPGFTTIQWWTAYNENIVSKTNQLAIIYLGNNGGLTDTLATDAPENTSYEQYANTNTGCYAKIIAKLKSIGAKIVLVKVYDVNETTNKVIEECGTRFNCAVVDNEKLSNIYRTYPDGSGVNPIHYNDFGYAQFTVNLLSKIAQLPDAMLRRILPA